MCVCMFGLCTVVRLTIVGCGVSPALDEETAGRVRETLHTELAECFATPDKDKDALPVPSGLVIGLNAVARAMDKTLPLPSSSSSSSAATAAAAAAAATSAATPLLSVVIVARRVTSALVEHLAMLSVVKRVPLLSVPMSTAELGALVGKRTAVAVGVCRDSDFAFLGEQLAPHAKLPDAPWLEYQPTQAESTARRPPKDSKRKAQAGAASGGPKQKKAKAQAKQKAAPS